MRGGGGGVGGVGVGVSGGGMQAIQLGERERRPALQSVMPRSLKVWCFSC